jgi:hypothetical protein
VKLVAALERLQFLPVDGKSNRCAFASTCRVGGDGARAFTIAQIVDEYLSGARGLADVSGEASPAALGYLGGSTSG